MKRVRGMWLVALGLILLAAPLFAGPTGEQPPAAGGTQWTIPYKGPEVELSVWMMTPAENPQDFVDNPNPYTAAQMKRLGNIKWKIYGNAVADYDARFPVLAASGPLYDINTVRSAPETTRNFGPSGQMLNLMDYLDKVPNAKKWLLDKYPKTLTGTTKDGKPGWFVVGVTGDGLTEMPEVYLYNKTLLDKYGIAVPKTSDEMLAAMKKLKAADPKIIPWIYMWKSFADMVWYSGLHDMFTQIRPTSIWWQPAKNKWVYGPIEPDGGLKETLQFVNEMYKNGLTNPDQESQTGDQFKAIAQSGLWGFTYTYYNEARVQPNGKGMILAGKRYAIKGMEIPKGTTGKNYLLWGSRAGGPGWGTAFNAKTKYPELIAALVNYMWSDENILAMNYGIEGETYTKDASGNPKFLPDWNTAISPTGYKDLNNWGLGSGVFPQCRDQLPVRSVQPLLRPGHPRRGGGPGAVAAGRKVLGPDPRVRSQRVHGQGVHRGGERPDRQDHGPGEHVRRGERFEVREGPAELRRLAGLRPGTEEHGRREGGRDLQRAEDDPAGGVDQGRAQQHAEVDVPGAVGLRFRRTFCNRGKGGDPLPSLVFDDYHPRDAPEAPDERRETREHAAWDTIRTRVPTTSPRSERPFRSSRPTSTSTSAPTAS